MPIYEFKCNACDADFEELLSSSTAMANVSCVYCGSSNVHRTLSLFGFACKDGSGETRRTGTTKNTCSGCQTRNCGQCH